MEKIKLITYRKRRSITILGKLLILICFIFIVGLIAVNLNSFLTITKSVESKLLVVEGWLPDYTLKGVMEEFYNNDYEKLIITGKPLIKGYYISKYKSSADIAEATLINFGFNKDLIETITIPRTIFKDRTYTTALAFESRLKKSDNNVNSINIYTLGCHSRRSRLLFEKALGKEIKIGIIAGKDLSYNPVKWWNSSRGFRTVMNEALAYLYAKLFFHPDKEKITEELKTGYYIDKIVEHRDNKNHEFTDKEKSPLTTEQLKIFKGLQYFPVNNKFRAMGVFLRDSIQNIFKMKTSTLRQPEYLKYGEIIFLIDTNTLKLTVYQNIELIKESGYENYLFIPFRDITSGNETYGGGRYLDFRIPETDSVFIDFNLSYNPYCVYNHKYSCPIPPAENSLSVKILAGEKAYK